MQTITNADGRKKDREKITTTMNVQIAVDLTLVGSLMTQCS